jgi:chromosome segregation ATPase
MSDTIQRIREANQARMAQSQSQAMQKSQIESNAATQRAIFESFKMMAEMFNSGQVKTSEVFKILESLEGKHKTSKTEIEMIKAGLDTLQKQIGEIPVGDLKQLPKFLQQKDSVKVSNLDELKDLMSQVLEAIKEQETTVEAPVVNVEKPVVNVPAPVVNVDAPNLSPIEKGLRDVKDAVKSNKYPEVVKTEQVNTLVSETFDQWKCIYDEFDPESEQVEAIVYYYKGKKVARINYTYDDSGRLKSGKKA